MAYSITLGTLPDCCGALVLHRFFKNTEPLRLEQYTENHKKEFGINQAWIDSKNMVNLAEDNNGWKNRVKTALHSHIDQWKLKKSYILVTLNEKEETVIGEVFRDVGFEVLVPMTKNPSGSAIILYIYHLLPKNAAPVESILKKA